MREALEAMKDQFFDVNGDQISNLMALHERRAGEIENLIKANMGTSQGKRVNKIQRWDDRFV